MSTLYFAYGSNLSATQLQSRVGKTRVVGSGLLRGYDLVFSGRSSVRKGATASVVKSRWGHVPGVVFMLSELQLRRLDTFEGHPTHYQRRDVKILLDAGGVVDAVTYARPEGTPIGKPSMDYFLDVLRGYRDHMLEEDPLLDALLRSAETDA